MFEISWPSIALCGVVSKYSNLLVESSKLSTPGLATWLQRMWPEKKTARIRVRQDERIREEIMRTTMETTLRHRTFSDFATKQLITDDVKSQVAPKPGDRVINKLTSVTIAHGFVKKATRVGKNNILIFGLWLLVPLMSLLETRVGIAERKSLTGDCPFWFRGFDNGMANHFVQEEEEERSVSIQGFLRKALFGNRQN
ncbi:hypothetical protein IEQ34_008391 [Dendrobium chrysotoxum]|uniref:Uncharacterized protein n=1 Tax=Dendrobium chrysotoxum TaxID=161865 RepID=A0AAV7GVQ9_DENCH|nr:hypothetical protein IEQ34_008391 [Dendrobium chrysotoxum]